jgi:hypothetical protein
MVGNIRQLSIRWFVPAKLKRKPFNSNVADYLLIIATVAFSYPLVLSDTSNICMCAFTVVAPGVRFNAFAIFFAPAFLALLETFDDRYPLRSKAGTSFFLTQPRSPLAPSRVFRVIVPPRG